MPTTDTDSPISEAPVRLSQRWQYASRQAISFLMQQAVENRDVISLAAGLVDAASLPVAETRAAAARLLSDDVTARAALQYGTTQGSERLRQLLLEHFARLEQTPVDQLGITADQLILTTGSQQLLSLVCEILLDPGDICLVAGPTYFVFLGNLDGVGAETINVPADDEGMCTAALEQTLQQLENEGRLDRVKLIYVVSYYDNPSSRSVSTGRRSEIVRIAREWSKHQRIFVLEDAAYRELRYDGETFPSIWSHDTDDRVIYTQTFSKSFAPGLRVGFGVLPQVLIKPICDRKGNEDFGSANFNQHLLADVLESGAYDDHVEEVRTAYRIKRDAMLTAADAYFTGLDEVHWVQPHGGLYVWMTLPERIDTGFESALFQKATKEHGVMYVPGELCFAGPPEDKPRHHLRLSYGVQTPAGIDQGMHRLSEAVRGMRSQSNRAASAP